MQVVHSRPPGALPRWVTLPFGLLLLPLALLSFVGTLLVTAAAGGNAGAEILAIAVGGVFLVLSFWLLQSAIRLILNKPRPGGGILGPAALRILAIYCVAMPIVALFAGRFEVHPFWYSVQALGMLLAAGGLWRMADHRKLARRIDLDQSGSGGQQHRKDGSQQNGR